MNSLFPQEVPLYLVVIDKFVRLCVRVCMSECVRVCIHVCVCLHTHLHVCVSAWHTPSIPLEVASLLAHAYTYVWSSYVFDFVHSYVVNQLFVDVTTQHGLPSCNSEGPPTSGADPNLDRPL